MIKLNETKVAQLFIICVQFASIYSCSNLAKILPASYFTSFAYGVSIFCFFLKYIALKGKFNISSLVNLFIMGLIACVVFLNARGAIFLELFLYILILKETNEIKIIQTFLVTKVVTSFVIFFLALLGFGDLYINEGGSARLFSFGFSNNNFIGVILFDVSMAAMLLHYYERKRTFLISTIAAALFCIFVIDCRSAVICYVAVLLLLAVGERPYK